MKKILSFVFALALGSYLLAQTDTTKNIRTGWTFGVLPSVSFDADAGFQYGALSNIYYFGDGSTYPDYLHSFYVEASNTTKHLSIFRLYYDSPSLIEGYRVNADLSYLPDALHDFFGFNGYQTLFDNTKLQDVSRAYYKLDRQLLRFAADISRPLPNHFNVHFGLGMLYFQTGSVNVARLNSFTREGKDTLPQVTTLYDKYREAGLISDIEANGGAYPFARLGISYDTRNRRNNPNRGICSDAFFTYYNGDMGDLEGFSNVKFNAAWRHYVPLLSDRITFAYRVGTQLTLLGKSPFYLNTYFNQLTLTRAFYDALGGASSLRGVLRNRIVGNGFAYANLELRATVADFTIGKEHFYIGLNPFFDAGMVVQPYDLSEVNTSADLYNELDINQDAYAPHFGAGCGLKVVMNENFVLSVDWARPLNNQDNNKMSNIYIKMGYLF